MKLISWNIYRNNKKFLQVHKFITQSKADIICLQECPKQFLKYLKQNNPNKYNITQTNEYFLKKNKSKSIKLYNVILSKYKIEKSQTIPHIKHEKFPIYYKLINKYKKIDIKAIYIDITNPKTTQKYRIFNSHLECVASPNFRINQFKNLITHKHENKQNIFLGDFNAFSNPLISLFIGPFSNYKPKDYITFEQKQFQKLFNSLNLKNLFKKQKTFKYFPFQTDFIILDKTIKYKTPKVHKKQLNGSDHYPIEVELE